MQTNVSKYLQNIYGNKNIYTLCTTCYDKYITIKNGSNIVNAKKLRCVYYIEFKIVERGNGNGKTNVSRRRTPF